MYILTRRCVYGSAADVDFYRCVFLFFPAEESNLVLCDTNSCPNEDEECYKDRTDANAAPVCVGKLVAEHSLPRMNSVDKKN